MEGTTQARLWWHGFQTGQLVGEEKGSLASGRTEVGRVRAVRKEIQQCKPRSVRLVVLELETASRQPVSPSGACRRGVEAKRVRSGWDAPPSRSAG